MTTRSITRLLVLLIAVGAATALMVGGLSLLASVAPDAAAAPRLEPNQAAELEKGIQASVRKKVAAPARDAADEAPGAIPTSNVVLVFAGIVLMAALPPVYAVHVYQRTYHPRF
jgi:hypothetical protein